MGGFDLMFFFRTRPAFSGVKPSDIQSLEAAVSVWGCDLPTVMWEVDRVIDVVQSLMQGKSVKLPDGWTYRQEDKLLRAEVLYATQVKVLIDNASSRGMLKTAETSVTQQILSVTLS